MFKLTLLNCVWLLIPALLWNLVFTSKLTQEGFKDDTGHGMQSFGYL